MALHKRSGSGNTKIIGRKTKNSDTERQVTRLWRKQTGSPQLVSDWTRRPFVDEFTGTLINRSIWTGITQASRQSVAGGRLRQYVSGGSAGYAKVITDPYIDLAGSSVVYHAASLPSGASWDAESGFSINGVGGYVSMFIVGSGADIRCRYNNNQNDLNIALPSGHMYWRIREASGSIYWESSSTGTSGSWTTLRSIANPGIKLEGMEVSLFSGYWNDHAIAANEAAFIEVESIRAEKSITKIIPSINPSFFSGIWINKLADNHPIEDRPAYNGTDDFTNNRQGRSYAQRIATMARYHSGSSPVAGYYPYGNQTYISGGYAPLYTIPTVNHSRQKVWLIGDDGNEMWSGTSNDLPQKFYSVPVPVGQDGQRFESYYGRELWGSGPDQALAIYDPYTNEMWEFWLFRWNATHQRYECRWGAYVEQAIGSSAPESLPSGWGSRATGLPLMSGVMRQIDYVRGEFKYPLSLAIPVVKPGYIPPAVRQDGTITWNVVNNDGRDAVPEGAWFRLPAGYSIDTSKPKIFQMFVKAVRDYGFIVNDGTGGAMTFSIEGAQAMGTPYSALSHQTVPHDFLGYGQQNILKDFPWDDLVQVKYVPPS